jgi:hypothetical protein
MQPTFKDWVKDLPINKRKFIVPDDMRNLFNLPETLRINIVSPSIKEILPGHLMLTHDMCKVLNDPGLEGIAVDTIAHPFTAPLKHLPKDEEYIKAYKMCYDLDFNRVEKEPEKTAIDVVKTIRKNVCMRLMNSFIVPVFTDMHTLTLNARFYLVQNYKKPIAVFNNVEQAEEYILMLRQLLYMHPEPDSIIERIPKYDIVEIPGLQED